VGRKCKLSYDEVLLNEVKSRKKNYLLISNNSREITLAGPFIRLTFGEKNREKIFGISKIYSFLPQ
jgi:hypothetical protein